MSSSLSDQLPEGIPSRHLTVNGLRMHILEANAGHARPLILLLHGFPELSFSWRKIIHPLAELGYHVVAPDQRGFGFTYAPDKSSPSESRVSYEDSLYPYRLLNLVTDIVALVHALGHTSVECIVGHDAGSVVAASSALIRPDIFKKVVMMSAPPPAPPLKFPNDRKLPTSSTAAYSDLHPPRKYYTNYFSGPTANDDILNSPGGLRDFFRAYFHMKSADWQGNQTRSLIGLSPEQIAEVLPQYYLMHSDATMPSTVLPHLPEKANSWFTDDDLNYYVSFYSQTGFQGGLNWYRTFTDPQYFQDMLVFSGAKIRVPAMFISGKKDWGVWQHPGAIEMVREQLCKDVMKEDDFVLVEGAGHWVQQEKPEEVLKYLERFLKQ